MSIERLIKLFLNNYKRYCTRCHYTTYPGEEVIKYNGGVAHSNCPVALSNKDIVRRINPRIEQLIGKVSKKKLVKMLEIHPLAGV